jgi:putative ABC transport system substrate-binding protein
LGELRDGSAAQVARKLTGTTPIVFIECSDPVGQGLVASLARRGGNVTGLSHLNAVLATKQLELLKQTVPAVTRVGLLRNANTPLDSSGEVDVVAQALAVQLSTVEVQRVSGPGDLEASLATVAGMQMDGLLALLPVITVRARIAALASDARIPLVSASRPWAEARALLTYGPNISDLYRRAAGYMDRILEGSKPADLPVEQPREFEPVLNLRTADALGLTIPERVLIQVTNVIR